MTIAGRDVTVGLGAAVGMGVTVGGGGAAGLAWPIGDGKASGVTNGAEDTTVGSRTAFGEVCPHA
ncbi:MAG TPA: hypothetical protein VE553_04630 [Candidatus Binatia bacterium]|jgi:hypothetical protein|nr:hypothetical protein [Candidatus Binatia bacterium]